MDNIIKKTRYKIFYVSTNNIKFCIKPTKYCDYTQYNSLKQHPHAGVDRGVFREDQRGNVKINNSNWDYKPGVLFSKLLEYKALYNHYNGKENWKKSEFAMRCVKYLELYNLTDRGFSNSKKFLIGREKQIDKLFKSILKNNVYPSNTSKDKSLFIDNFSILLTKKNKLYFNNRGHHRLSIAKILKIKKIPIKITLAKSKKILEHFFKIHK